MSKKNKQTIIHQPVATLRASSILCGLVALVWIVIMGIYRRGELTYALDSFPAILRPLLSINATHFIEFGADFFLLVYLFGSAILAGRILFQLFKFDGIGFEEELVFSLGLGLGFFSLAALILGLLGFFSIHVFRGGLMSLSGVSLMVNILFFPMKKVDSTKTTVYSEPYGIGLMACLLVGLVVLNFLGAMGPEVFYDSLVYHLALPKLYLLNGRIFPTPYNIYSGIPFNTEMLYGISLAIGGGGLAKLLPWGLSIAVLYLIFIWVRRYANVGAALLAMLMFYSAPMTSEQTWHSMVEMNWCFFGLLAVFALMLGQEAERLSKRRIVLMGLLCGIGMGIKYNAFSLPIILIALFAWKTVKKELHWKELINMTFILLTVTFLTFSPWLLKNLYFYKNPIFPFFNEWFPRAPQVVDWRALVVDASGRDIKRTFTSLDGFFNLFSTLWSKERDSFDSIGTGCFLFLPWLFFPQWTTAPFRNLLFIFPVAWASWAFYTTMPRFFLFALPYMAILLGTALVCLEEGKLFKRLFYCIALLSCVVNCLEVLRNWDAAGAWKVDFGVVNRDEYLRHTQRLYPTPYYSGIEFINMHLPADSKILFIDESRGYYCERNFIATTLFAQSPVTLAANESRDAEELLSRIRAMDVTHILVNRQEIDRRGNHTPFTHDGEAAFVSFANKYLRLLFEKRNSDPDDPQWTQVYELIERKS